MAERSRARIDLRRRLRAQGDKVMRRITLLCRLSHEGVLVRFSKRPPNPCQALGYKGIVCDPLVEYPDPNIPFQISM